MTVPNPRTDAMKLWHWVLVGAALALALWYIYPLLQLLQEFVYELDARL